MKVEIIKCHKATWWYDDRIGGAAVEKIAIEKIKNMLASSGITKL